MEDKKKFMVKAIELSIKSANTIGGPFGSVIVKDERIIAEGSNKVTSTNDPTAHGEIVAIREACKNLNTFDLSGCEIYTSCEPCPMCLSAIYWSRLNKKLLPTHNIANTTWPHLRITSNHLIV